MLTPGPASPGTSRITLAAAALIIILGAVSAAYVYQKVSNTGRGHIVDRAATIAVSIAPESVAALSAS